MINMKTFSSFLICFLLFTSCNEAQNRKVVIPQANKTPVPNEAVATFAEGCFWHSEIVFQSLIGVRDAVSGYSGGTGPAPDYENVTTGRTGHAESVQVYYDPAKISFETLVKAYFASMDPTSLNRQGNDEGTQYRSIAFYRNEAEKQVIINEINRLTQQKKNNRKIVTEVKPLVKFYPAEVYHQEYIYNHPDESYVRNVSIPDYQRFRQSFDSRYFK
ncbi:peptide-methionine (S)-S-oxide reductase MsrA [soil metagenome]